MVMHVSRASMCTFANHANVSLASASMDRMLLNIKMVESSMNMESMCEHQHGKKAQMRHKRINVLLDVPIMILGRADGPRESEETEDTAEIESNGCQSSTGVRAWINEGCWQADKSLRQRRLPGH